jgi:hypothetical protein
MGKETRFFDAFEKRIKLSIHTFAPGRVVRYYSTTKEADIELLFMSADKNGVLAKYPLIQKAPVLKHVGVLSENDVVFVAFSERALDNLQNKPFDPGTRRMHDVRDAVVIGAWDV